MHLVEAGETWKVSFRRLLRDRFVRHQILHPTCLIDRQATTFIAVPIQRPLGNPGLPARFHCLGAPADQNLALTQLRDDLTIFPVLIVVFRLILEANAISSPAMSCPI